MPLLKSMIEMLIEAMFLSDDRLGKSIPVVSDADAERLAMHILPLAASKLSRPETTALAP